LEKINANIRAKTVWTDAVSAHCGFIKIHLRPNWELLAVNSAFSQVSF